MELTEKKFSLILTYLKVTKKRSDVAYVPKLERKENRFSGEAF